MRLPALSLVAVAALSACAPFPEVEALGTASGPPPALIPLEPVLGALSAPTEDPGPALSARAARLKARAAAIKAGPPAT
ncbi:MAG: hypothetical protein MUE83_09215 [Tabrizicola sp.]|jgi:hypothetical protein|nr:hypothetical protein [Tabrizicola sp.]